MAVYVYRFGGQRRKAFTVAYPRPWFGLTADTEDELHPFAQKLGLNRQLYRPRTVGGLEVPLVGHYDLSEAERNRAIAGGAQPLTTREHAKLLKERAAALGIRL